MQFEQAPTANFDLHHHFVQQKVKYIIPHRNTFRRLSIGEEIFAPEDQFLDPLGFALEDQLLKPFGEPDSSEEDCPGAPFLWKIVEDATGKHVGFSLGTMHLPHDVVTTADSLASIHHAIAGR